MEYPKNLKGNHGKLLYFRREEAEGKEPVIRKKNGQTETHYRKIQKKVYFDEQEVKRFSLEKMGKPLPRVQMGFIQVDNYFFDYWTYILGVNGTNAYIHLLRYCYGDKNTCFPNMQRIADKMHITLPTLRKALTKLEDHGFIYRFWIQNPEMNNLEESILFKVRKTVPFLSESLIETLPSALRKEHDEYVANLMESYEIEFRLDAQENYQSMYDSLRDKATRVAHPKSRHTDKKATEMVQVMKTKMTATETKFWDEVLESLKEKISKPMFETWFMDSYCALEESTVHVYFKHQFAREWVENRYHNLLNSIITKNGFQNVEYHEVALETAE